MLLAVISLAFSFPSPDVFDPFGGKAVPNTFGRAVCNTAGALKTAAHQLSAYRNPVNISYEQEMANLNRVNTMQETDVRREVFTDELSKPEWLTVFSLHSGFSYCNTSDPQKLSEFGTINPDVSEGLPTGPFKVESINDFSAYVGPYAKANQSDGRFTIAVSDPQQLIIMTWRGTAKSNDYLADGNATAIGLEDEFMVPFRDGDSPILNPSCKVPEKLPEDFFLFAGIAQVMQSHVNELVVQKLVEVQSRYPTYSVVVTGHSLGAAKAFITAFHIAKFHPEKINFKALYSYAQPLVGSTSFSTWMAECIGPDRIIRVVSSNDLVPWVREAKNVQHPQPVAEYFNPNPEINTWRICQGPNDDNCSAGTSCLRKNWVHHSLVAGVRVGTSLCWYIHLKNT